MKRIIFCLLVGMAQVSLANKPVNDDFADRIVLPGAQGVVFGYNRGASMEVGEPLPFTNSSRSVWYQWTAPADGQVRFSVAGLNGLTISTRTYLGGLTVNTLTNFGALGGANLTLVNMTRDVIAGMILYFPVGTFGAGAVGGDFSVSWDFNTVPQNDDFANRIALPGVSGVVTGSNRGASMEVGEPLPFTNSSRSVWYQWTAPADGQVRFTVAGFSGFTISTRLYLGGTTVNTLTNFGALGGANLTLVNMTCDVTAGMILYFPVGTFGAGAVGGDFSVSWDADFPKPPNDDFAQAFVLSGDSTGGHAYNMTATKETGEPNHAGNVGGSSLWWIWTAPNSGTASLIVEGEGITVLAAVYTGDAVDNLTQVAAGAGTVTTSQFPVTAGTVYAIALDGANGQQGYMDFSLALDGAIIEPEFTSFAISGSLVTGELIASPGAIVLIEVSPDLVTNAWQHVLTLTNHGSSSFSIPLPGGTTQGVFRALSSP